jgi:hypothetical protein
LGVKADSTIKDGMIIVSPKRKNFMGREVLEASLPSSHSRGTTSRSRLSGIFTHILQKPLKPLIKNLVQKFGISLVFTGQGKGLAHKIVGFLIHHQGKLVIHQPIVGKVVNFLKFAILPIIVRLRVRMSWKPS